MIDKELQDFSRRADWFADQFALAASFPNSPFNWESLLKSWRKFLRQWRQFSRLHRLPK